MEFSNAHASEGAALGRHVGAATRDGFFRQELAVEWQLQRVFGVSIQGFEHAKVPTSPEERARSPWLREYRLRPTEVHRDSTVPYLAAAAPWRTVPLPAGYVVLPSFVEALDTLRAHGIAVERLLRDVTMAGERYALAKVDVAPRLF